jgi:uncharacterized protein YhfF
MAIPSLPHAEFAFPGPLRDALIASILGGRKTATTSLLAEYAIEGEELPVVGRRKAVIDSKDEPVAVIETVYVKAVRLDEVPLVHAIDEGEGHDTVARWRADHEQFWHSVDMRAYLQDPGFMVTDETLVVLERFRLIS